MTRPARKLAALHHFRAIWPVTDPTVPYADLIAAAREDLPAVALRHGVRVHRATAPRVIEGRMVPGSGGAQHVVVIDASVVRLRDVSDDAARKNASAA